MRKRHTAVQRFFLIQGLLSSRSLTHDDLDESFVAAVASGSTGRSCKSSFSPTRGQNHFQLCRERPSPDVLCPAPALSLFFFLRLLRNGMEWN